MAKGERSPLVAFVTLGCKVNQTESDAIAESLGMLGDRAQADDADVVVVNTCTVTGEADHKARKAVRHALALPLAPVVVVTGCLAAIDADALRALGPRVVAEPSKERVAARVREALEARGLRSDALAPSGLPTARTRVQLKVQDGCDAFCSYCIVPYARGLPKAVPLADVVARAEHLVAGGVQELVLTGINIGRYNHSDAGLPDVLAAVAGTGVRRIRLSSIEPGDVTECLLEAAAATPAFCQHFHVPLQSGSDTVLARMHRPYDTGAFAEVIERIRSRFPGAAISTDVIAGFPGETDAEFRETLAFLAAQAFARLHVFRYSARSGTPAAEMPDQVPAAIRAERSAVLRSLGERCAMAYADACRGSAAELLVERVTTGEDDVELAEGTTREYLRVRARPADAGAVAPGSVHGVLLEGRDEHGIVHATLLD